MKKQLEKHIQAAILDYLKLKGYFVWRNQTTGIFNKKSGGYIPSQSVGAPDIYLLTKGSFWGLEVKRQGGVLSDYQKAFGALIEANGGHYAVVTSIGEVQELGL